MCLPPRLSVPRPRPCPAHAIFYFGRAFKKKLKCSPIPTRGADVRFYNRGTRGRLSDAFFFGWCCWVCLLCGSKLRIRCCVLLYLDLMWARIGRRTSETTSLSPTWPMQNRSENSPTRPKTGRRFSVSDLSLTVTAQPASIQSGCWMAALMPGPPLLLLSTKDRSWATSI